MNKSVKEKVASAAKFLGSLTCTAIGLLIAGYGVHGLIPKKKYVGGDFETLKEIPQKKEEEEL